MQQQQWRQAVLIRFNQIKLKFHFLNFLRNIFFGFFYDQIDFFVPKTEKKKNQYSARIL